MGWGWVFPKKLRMEAGSRIDHGTVVKGLEELTMEENAYIGRLNWITGEPMESNAFLSERQRNPKLILEKEAAITNRHLIDCTDEVLIGAFSTVAGFRSQILTHSINLHESRQECHSISIGSYCFIGTGVIILGGAKLPDYSVLGAGAVLNKKFEQCYRLYAGVPAREIQLLEGDKKYFSRKIGYVD